ncbi:serine hydroxymethyltransferase [Candidatus Microgenomates bacterium]|nr:serine hydroxymethyltransferase [Candidatus Microgenomates bacterium]
MKFLTKEDQQIADLIVAERKRQEESLQMIPSENTTSRAVEEAVGSSLGNKYSEGYPTKRFYQGQGIVDQIEIVTQNRAKALFGVPHVNVQPYSGSPANLEAYLAVAEPGDTIMGLVLSSGGHLTHGAQASATSRIFNSVQYNVTQGGFIDYEAVELLAKKNKPKIIIAGFTAYPRTIDWKRFAAIADKVGAYLITDIAHIAGLVAGGAHPSPVPYAHIITTTTHKSLRGPRGAMIMVTERGLEKNPELANLIDKSVFPGAQGGPHMNTIAGIGVALNEASTKHFVKYVHQIVNNAKALAAALEKLDFQIVTGGTDNHLMVVDLRNKELRGKTTAEALELVGIILNYNTVPFDPNPPFSPSGIRLGTPGITSRGMKEADMKPIAKAMHETVTAVAATKKKLGFSYEDERKKSVRIELFEKTPELKKIRKDILALCKKFPLLDSY